MRFQIIPYGLDKVRFAQSAAAINEKRVVRILRSANHGLRCGVSKLIEWADNEMVECIARVKVVIPVDIHLSEW